MTSFAGLDSLAAIWGNLVVSNNPVLASFEGLGTVSTLGSELLINQNLSLPTALAQTYADTLAGRGHTGKVTIEGNMP